MLRGIKELFTKDTTDFIDKPLKDPHIVQLIKSISNTKILWTPHTNILCIFNEKLSSKFYLTFHSKKSFDDFSYNIFYKFQINNNVETFWLLFDCMFRSAICNIAHCLINNNFLSFTPTTTSGWSVLNFWVGTYNYTVRLFDGWRVTAHYNNFFLAFRLDITMIVLYQNDEVFRYTPTPYI